MKTEKVGINGFYDSDLFIVYNHLPSNLGTLQYFLDSAKSVFTKIQNEYPGASIFNATNPDHEFPTVQKLNAIIDLILTMWLDWSKFQTGENKRYNPVLSKTDIEIEIDLDDQLWISFSHPENRLGGSIESRGHVNLWKKIPCKTAKGEVETHHLHTQFNTSQSNSWIFNFLFDVDKNPSRNPRYLELFADDKLEFVFTEEVDKQLDLDTKYIKAVNVFLLT